MNILVLGGGSSPERDVSLRSASAVRDALTELNHDVTYLDPAKITKSKLLAAAHGCDVTLPVLHGAGGEDGSLQQLFDKAGIRYLGSNPEACRLTFNKTVFKETLRRHTLPTPAYEIVTADSFAGSPLARQPFVLKPLEGGSSIDTFIVRVLPYDNRPLQTALAHYGKMLLEELIEGQEVTVGILDEKPLPVIEIIPPAHGEFDYTNKYNGSTAELCPPKNVSQQLQRQAQKLALKIHQAAGCRHLSRTDIMISRGGDLSIIDTNTIPGLTAQSLFPKAAREAGYQWIDLVGTFVQLAARQ